MPIAARIREHEEVWVAEEDGRLLGFLGIEHSTNLDAPVLEKLYVEPGGAEPRRRLGAPRQGEGAPAGRAVPLGLPEEPGAPPVRAPRLRAREAHGRLRQHGTGAGRALPLERERVNHAPDVGLVLLHQHGFVDLEMSRQQPRQPLLDAGQQRVGIVAPVEGQRQRAAAGPGPRRDTAGTPGTAPRGRASSLAAVRRARARRTPRRLPPIAPRGRCRSSTDVVTRRSRAPCAGSRRRARRSARTGREASARAGCSPGSAPGRARRVPARAREPARRGRG